MPRSDRKRKSHQVKSPKADVPITPSLPPSQAEKIKNFAAFCKVKFNDLFFLLFVSQTSISVSTSFEHEKKSSKFRFVADQLINKLSFKLNKFSFN